MLERIALDGFWLIGGLAVAVLLGVFIAQYIKDKIKGVPSPLRTALQATEASALAEIKKAEAAVVAAVAKKANAAVAAQAATAAVPPPVAAPAPAAAAPAAAPPAA